jgi:hypothetical protein
MNSMMKSEIEFVETETEERNTPGLEFLRAIGTGFSAGGPISESDGQPAEG